MNRWLVALGACLVVQNSSLSAPLRLYYFTEEWVVSNFTLVLASSQQILTDIERCKKYQQVFSGMISSTVFEVSVLPLRP